MGGGVMIRITQCFYCMHLSRLPREQMIVWRCKAYPEGIPEEIWRNEVVHNELVHGDQGILFEQKHDFPFKLDIDKLAESKEKSREFDL